MAVTELCRVLVLKMIFPKEMCVGSTGRVRERWCADHVEMVEENETKVGDPS